MAESQRIMLYRVSGRVQGVGYRWFVKHAADELGVRGWVKNLRDGDVEALASGSDRALALFERRLKQGPGYAVVTSVDETEVETDQTFNGFQITY